MFMQQELHLHGKQETHGWLILLTKLSCGVRGVDRQRNRRHKMYQIRQV